MYPNLLAELARHKIRQKDLASPAGCNVSSLSRKMNTGTFTLNEAKAIRDMIDESLPLDVLFKWED